VDDRHPQRRRFPRIPTTNAVLVNRLGDDALEAVTTTRVVGLGGLSFVSTQPFGKASLLQLIISAADESVQCLGRVAYEREVDSGWEVGVEFLFLNEVNQRRIASILAAAEARGERPEKDPG
jgi:hypothetical protein